MDKLLLTGAVSQPDLLKSLGKVENSLEEKKKVQFAKDFESIFINRLLEEMNNTIGKWGFEKDGAAEQVQGIFWMYLAQDIAEQGGFGLWQDIYKSLAGPELTNTATESLDRKL